jgi:hypothetical protein
MTPPLGTFKRALAASLAAVLLAFVVLLVAFQQPDVPPWAPLVVYLASFAAVLFVARSQGGREAVRGVLIGFLVPPAVGIIVFMICAAIVISTLR